MKVARGVNDVHGAQQDQRVEVAFRHFLLDLGDLAPIPVRREAVWEIRGGARQRGRDLQFVSTSENRHAGSEGQGRRSGDAAEAGRGEKPTKTGVMVLTGGK